ncbi:hypothetical protein D9M69_693610 [compost metagenome]
MIDAFHLAGVRIKLRHIVYVTYYRPNNKITDRNVDVSEFSKYFHVNSPDAYFLLRLTQGRTHQALICRFCFSTGQSHLAPMLAVIRRTQDQREISL